MNSNPPHHSTAISGDLPIRSSKPMRPPTLAETENPPCEDAKPPTMSATIEEVPEDSPPKPNPRVGAPQTKLDDEVALRAGEIMASVIHKPRRRKPKSKRGLGKPTGFEEYYADGPMTPAEHEESRQTYDPSYPFEQRIQEALTRFQWKRRMENDRRAIFFKYLQYGGVDASQNYGTGVSPKELKQMSNDEARQARSQTMIPRDRQEQEVNFEEVARGFLSSYYANHYNPDSQESINIATSTIRNLLTYLLYHEVCPEYKDNILKARRICDIASVELWKNVQLVQDGPGKFNESCSMLFGGRYHGSGQDTNCWIPAQCCSDGNLTPDAARKVVKFAIAGTASHEQACRFQALVTKGNLSAKQILDIDGFEVTSINQPDDDIRDFHHEFAPDLPVVGKIKAKSFRNPAKPDIDMTPAERKSWQEGKAPKYDFEFFLEEELLQNCYPGLRITSDIWEINCGVYYFDEIISAYPSFHKVLANDLMMRWKTPREIVEEKPNILEMQVEDVPRLEADDDPEEDKKPDHITEAVKEALRATGLENEADEVDKE
ncbi:uncharacterized protein N7496_006999 [Penicillium cataractarum]|uniref:Argonaute complex, subunit Arb1 n=1 Tax=Penicillium cataractarum TaxID=2100454 RepID=A0A9W9S3B1_9EURO|nr:uncharacterized protein N7496_006999 [Penicillium cataractarum]KAJ5370907.1 hypothetical protein N7496_006999 [Penicillium cataractarum]